MKRECDGMLSLNLIEVLPAVRQIAWATMKRVEVA